MNIQSNLVAPGSRTKSKLRRFGAALSLLILSAVSLQAVSVTDFGAVGNGRTDDTDAFRAAMREAARKGEKLDIPAGRYYLGGDLTIDQPVAFTGVGHESSIITGRGGKARLFVEASGTSFTDLGFEEMTAPIALVSRSGYTLKDISVLRCRFEDIYTLDIAHQGVIGLSTSSKNQRPHRIDDLLVEDSIFQNIESAAINVRGNISRVRVVNNQFLDIVNSDTNEGSSGWALGGYAVRLGESSDDAGMKEEFADQGHHLIEGNVIRNLRKRTVKGNLKAMLLYGNFIKVRNNLFEDIDGGANGDDVNAMYFRGAYNEISNNIIRNIRGSDDDGAVSFKGGLDLGNQGSVVFHNYIENIVGMSAIEASSSDIEVYENEVVNATTRGFYQRYGTNAIVRNNIFRNADTQLRTDSGEVAIHDNWYIDSVVWLSTHRGESVNRDGVYIHDNLFQRTSGSNTQMIRFSNNPDENFVSIRRNRFEYLNDAGGGDVIDLSSSLSSLREAEIIDNHIEQKGNAKLTFAVSASRETVSNNVFSSKADFTDTDSDSENAPGIPPEAPSEPVEPGPGDPGEPNNPDDPVLPADFRIIQSSNPGLYLTWTGQQGQVYQVQVSSDLQTWSDHGDPIPGTNGEISFSDLPSNADSMFFRLSVSIAN